MVLYGSTPSLTKETQRSTSIERWINTEDEARSPRKFVRAWEKSSSFRVHDGVPSKRRSTKKHHLLALRLSAGPGPPAKSVAHGIGCVAQNLPYVDLYHVIRIG